MTNKEYFIDKIKYLKENFSEKEINNFIILLFNMILAKEDDPEILSIIRSIIEEKITINEQHQNHSKKDMMINTNDFEELPFEFQRLFSYKLFYPLNKKYYYYDKGK